MVSSTRFFTALFIGAAVASPTLVSRAGVTRLTIEDIVGLRPYALFARAAFCSPAKLKTWTCGTACNDLPEMVVEDASEGSVTAPGWFVGYYPGLNTVVVSNQGTDPSEAVSSLTDADVAQGPLDSSLFPGVDRSVQVHEGFQLAQAASAATKLEAVEALITAYGASSITLTGLGRGGAISSLDALYLSLHLTNVNITLVTHGMPRVGNQAFANYVDEHLRGVSRITNRRDPLPTQPGRFFGYVHSSGEKHIVANNYWVACAGQDNNDEQCSTGAVPNIFEGDLGDNQGPYDDITIDGSACDA